MSSSKESTSKQSADSGAAGSEARHLGGFLGGSGDGRLVKRLLVGAQEEEERAEPIVAKTSSLIDRLRNFLPQLERANAALQDSDVQSSGIDIIPGGMSSDEDEDEEDHDRDEDDDNTSSDDEEQSGPKIEMNLSLFPVNDKDDNDDDIRIPSPQNILPKMSKAVSKQNRIEELS